MSSGSSYGEPTFINRLALAAIASYRFVSGTTTDTQVQKGPAGGAGNVGATHQDAADAAGARVDIATDGIVPVEFGQDGIKFGDLLTSDADGKALVAGPGDQICGVALENGDTGARGTVMLTRGPQNGYRYIGELPALAPSAADTAPAAADIQHLGIYEVPTTNQNATVTLPAAAKVGITIMVVADGAKNGHTIQYRDATGPRNLTAALAASKSHGLLFMKLSATKWIQLNGAAAP